MFKRALFLSYMLASSLTLPLTGKIQRVKYPKAPPAKVKGAPQKKVPKKKPYKPTLLTTTLHHIMLTTLGSSIMLPLCMQFGADDAHKISVIMNPLRWSRWKSALVTFGVLINLLTSFAFAYLYANVHRFKLKFPLLSHTTAYFLLCLEGAIATFLFFYFIDPESIHGLNLGKLVASLPILCSILYCLGTAYLYHIPKIKSRWQAKKHTPKEASQEEAKPKEDQDWLDTIYDTDN